MIFDFDPTDDPLLLPRSGWVWRSSRSATCDERVPTTPARGRRHSRRRGDHVKINKGVTASSVRLACCQNSEICGS